MHPSQPFVALAMVVSTLALSLSGRAAASAGPSAMCQSAIAQAEAADRIPDAFLSAIARVESGRADPSSGSVLPWPWTVNANGQGSFYATKAEAIAAVEALQAQGTRSIDVGCLQVNLMHHPEAFASLDQAFEPQSNAVFAGSLLVSLFAQTGSWPHAAAAYHSQTPTIGADYQKKVLAAWAEPEHESPRKEQHGSGAPKAAEQSPIETGGGRVVTGFVASPPSAPSRMAGPAGRDLAAYRSAPVRLAWKPST